MLLITSAVSSLELVIKRSKTDQLGAGATLEIPFGRKAATCPVRALRACLEVAGIVDGPVFREVDRHGNVAPARLSAQTVARVVKRRLRAAGFDPPPFSGTAFAPASPRKPAGATSPSTRSCGTLGTSARGSSRATCERRASGATPSPDTSAYRARTASVGRSFAPGTRNARRTAFPPRSSPRARGAL
jgi:hypothetical protein